jgi:hypothetical protein
VPFVSLKPRWVVVSMAAGLRHVRGAGTCKNGYNRLKWAQNVGPFVQYWVIMYPNKISKSCLFVRMSIMPLKPRWVAVSTAAAPPHVSRAGRRREISSLRGALGENMWAPTRRLACTCHVFDYETAAVVKHTCFAVTD